MCNKKNDVNLQRFYSDAGKERPAETHSYQKEVTIRIYLAEGFKPDLCVEEGEIRVSEDALE